MTWLQALLLALAGALAALTLTGRRGRAWSWRLTRNVLLGGACLLTLIPFVWLACMAVKAQQVAQQYAFLPPPWEWSSATINFDNFRQLFCGHAPGEPPFWRYGLNSLFLACTATLVQVVLCSMAGWALAKQRFRFRGALTVFVLGSMAIPSMVLLAPLYRITYELGWLDTWLPLLVPGAVSAFGVFLFRQAAQSVPDELIEAARIDGAGELRTYLQIGMPLVRPMTGAFCLISFLGQWNSFLPPQIYLSRSDLLTLPVVLNQYVGLYTNQYGVFLAGTLIAIIPPAVLFFALQREFISGLTSGAVKG